jgi:hypothetical protein
MLTQDQIEDWNESEAYYNAEHYPINMTPLDMVAEFCKTTGQEPTPSLYVKLVGEELDEWAKEGMIKSEQDLKELADLVYVLYGYESNLGRVRQDDGTVVFREDGKVLKNKDFPKVDLSDLL